MYGTWNSPYAAPASRNVVPTQSAAAVGPTSGTANMRTNSGGSVRPPASIHGRRGPKRDVVRSDQPPTTGFQSTSRNFGTNTAAPATAAGTASVSVRKYSSTSPGTVPNVPVASDPAA
jgi:hypothetical protein